MANLAMHGHYGITQDSYAYPMQDGITKALETRTGLGVPGQGLDTNLVIV